jgi:hypothetical protein
MPAGVKRSRLAADAAGCVVSFLLVLKRGMVKFIFRAWPAPIALYRSLRIHLEARSVRPLKLALLSLRLAI